MDKALVEQEARVVLQPKEAAEAHQEVMVLMAALITVQEQQVVLMEVVEARVIL